jgi:hypothetical protein
MQKTGKAQGKAGRSRLFARALWAKCAKGLHVGEFVAFKPVLSTEGEG